MDSLHKQKVLQFRRTLEVRIIRTLKLLLILINNVASILVHQRLYTTINNLFKAGTFETICIVLNSYQIIIIISARKYTMSNDVFEHRQLFCKCHRIHASCFNITFCIPPLSFLFKEGSSVQLLRNEQQDLYTRHQNKTNRNFIQDVFKKDTRPFLHKGVLVKVFATQPHQTAVYISCFSAAGFCLHCFHSGLTYTVRELT